MLHAIYPAPKEVTEQEGRFSFGATLQAAVSENVRAHANAAFLKELWNGFCHTAASLEIAYSSAEGYTLSVGGAKPVSSEGYDYSVVVTKDGFALHASTYTGFAHAYVTLLQLIVSDDLSEGREAFHIPCCTVLDKPASEYRMVHLCVFPSTTLPWLKKIVRTAGILKYSHIVLEFWGMYRYECYPHIAWENAYTTDEIKPLISDANTLGIEVVPMLNCLGHAAQARISSAKHAVLDRYPRDAMYFEPDGWTWCISNPETKKLLSAMRKELCDLCGDGSFFHIGCDEAYSFATCEKCRIQDRNELLSSYLSEIACELRRNGRRTILWGDMLLEHARWANDGYVASSQPSQNTHLICEKLPKDMIVADWHYDITDPAKNGTIRYFRDFGFEVLSCPWHDNANVAALSQIARENGGMGTLLTTWHTLQQHTRLLHFGAYAMWGGDTSRWQQPEHRYEIEEPMSSSFADILRKVGSPAASYEDAGLYQEEVNYRHYSRE